MEIVLLDKTDFKDFPLIFNYTTNYYYDVEFNKSELFSIKFVKKKFDEEVFKSFTSKLYEDWLENPSAFELRKEGKSLGYLEVDRESWSNRLRITELLILDEYRNLGYGSILMNKAKEIAKSDGLREIILETQSCNFKAISFYLKSGFIINGIDLSCYSNDDVDKKEVRIEMVFRV
ncbi:MAG: GNAT family N-acetyltransferase [Tissierellaceae bacterium]|nr:GNAT family N-acetyltransferase [Tissierellaceae bacterium]